MDELDRILWKNLTHAYGSAEDVPDLLRALRTASPDEKGDGTPLYELFGNIWHQGTVYEATAYAVPFLIDLATDSQTPDRAGILQLLAEIAKGSSYRAVHGNLQQESDFEAKKANEQDWVAKAYDAVAAGFNAFVALTKESSLVRLAAAHVLAQLTSNAARVASIICAMLDAKENSNHRAGLLLLLGQSSDRSQSTLATLNRAVTDPDQTQRLAAACSLSVLRPVPLSEGARKAVMEAILTSDFEERFNELPWDAQGEIACAADKLPACLDPREIELVANQFLTAIQSGTANQHQVGTLINMLFPLGNRGRARQLGVRDLSPMQQRTVRVLAAAMEGGRRIFYGHFPCWGLPDTMREWRALAAGVDPPEIDMSLPVLADPANPRRAINLRLLRPGAIITHRHFGNGKVTLVEHGDNDYIHLNVIFDDEGPKELSFPLT